MLHSRFVVCDQNGDSKYMVTGKCGSAIHKLAISDLQGEVLVTIHLAPFKSFKAFVISDKSERFLMVASLAEKRLQFRFHGISWTMCQSADRRSFDIVDADASLIMTQSAENFLTNDSYELEIFITDRELFCVAAAVCADMINLADNTVAAAT